MSCPLDAREPGECCGQDWHTGRWPAQTPSGDRTPGDVTKGFVIRDGSGRDRPHLESGSCAFIGGGLGPDDWSGTFRSSRPDRRED